LTRRERFAFGSGFAARRVKGRPLTRPERFAFGSGLAARRVKGGPLTRPERSCVRERLCRPSRQGQAHDTPGTLCVRERLCRPSRQGQAAPSALHPHRRARRATSFDCGFRIADWGLGTGGNGGLECWRGHARASLAGGEVGWDSCIAVVGSGVGINIFLEHFIRRMAVGCPPRGRHVQFVGSTLGDLRRPARLSRRSAAPS